MKVFLRYEDNEDKSLHKSLKITLPKSWKNGPTSKLLTQFVESYNSSDLGGKNPLVESDLHLAVQLPADADGKEPEIELSPLASDAITIQVIPDREEVLIVHGPSQTLAEIQAEKAAQKEAERAKLANTMSCLHFGCNNRLPIGIKPEDCPKCVYHKSPPVFHETAKFWSCCPDKKAYDWEEFQAIPGCMVGVCTIIKEDEREDGDKQFLGGCDLREKLNGGEKLKSIDDFNAGETEGESDAAPVLERLRQDLEEIGVENELFDQVTDGILKEIGDAGDGSESTLVANELGKKLKDAMKAIAVDQLRIK